MLCWSCWRRRRARLGCEVHFVNRDDTANRDNADDSERQEYLTHAVDEACEPAPV